MPNFTRVTPPSGEIISLAADGSLLVPDNPIIPHLEGDGIGRDLSRAMRVVVNAAVEKAYGGKKKISWFDVHAGEAAMSMYNSPLPEDTLEAIRTYRVSIKGPLTTPVGGGIRSLNVALRQIFDLYACVRPVRWFAGVPSPVKSPEKLDVVIFRENTEDVYSGIEFREGTPEAKKLIDYIVGEFKKEIRPDSGIGIKPISVTGSKRLVRMALQFAVAQGRPSVTLVHKGNIMKFTEGAFKDWGYEVARDEFGGDFVSEESIWADHGGKAPAGKKVVNDRIADAMFQQILLRPDEYSVLATTNLNGDYLSDACAAQVGGLGMAPGANIGTGVAVFEATHGTAPKYADKDMANPGSLILSAVMMLEHMGWNEPAKMIVKGIEGAIAAKTVTYDLERQMEGATKVGTRGFGEAIVKHMD